ncbi:MAG TPA: YncE family protein [Longimicrobiales bacterium]|nr:YncE family protein [Longimicrobiales bacterium]
MKLQASGVRRRASVRGAAAFVALFSFSACAGAGAGAGAGAEPGPPARDYLVFVASEATDQVALVRFGPGGARVERRYEVGIHPTDPDGPHGVAVAPDGRHYYVTTGHGVPYGYIWKYTTDGAQPVGRAELGMFPASLDVSPDGHYAYVVNFNLFGAMVPSSVSVVSTDEMVEVARLTTCTMPHGSRLDASGAHHYSACMMEDFVVDIDTRTFEIARHFRVMPRAERGYSGAPAAMHHHQPPGEPTTTRCSPTWVTPTPDGARLFVACNAHDDIVEIDVASWRMLRRIPAGEGVYNLDITHDGETLIATNKRGRSVSLFDVASGRELARIATQRPVVHGVTVSDDDRYAFISVEGVGSEPGTVEVIDLAARRRVASVDVGQMAGGIDFWRSEEGVR